MIVCSSWKTSLTTTLYEHTSRLFLHSFIKFTFYFLSPELLHVDTSSEVLSDHFDWKRHIADDAFGPSNDHTLGSPQGFYLLLDTRNIKLGEKAIYMSERIRSYEVCLKLWYNMPSYSDGTKLQIYSSSDFKTALQHLEITNSTNEEWYQITTTVTPIALEDAPFNDFWIYLFGVAGNNHQGYLAVDDISINDGTCENKTDSFDCNNGEYVPVENVCNFRKDCTNGYDEENCTECDFEKHSCGWNSQNNYEYFRWSRLQAGRENLNFDHTIEDSSGHFVIASAPSSWSSYNFNATLKSSTLRDSFSTCSIQFWYNLYGKMKLRVTLERNNKTIDLWMPVKRSDLTWTKAEIFLGRIPKEFQINFVAVREPGDECHAAVDDIAAKDCDTPTVGEPGMCRENNFDCKNSRCIPRDNVCDYTDDCGNFEDEKREVCLTALSRCNFDQSFCNWVKDSSTENEWQLRGPFPSLEQGPTRDHTSGFTNGRFLFLASRMKAIPARLLGPILQPAENCKVKCFIFAQYFSQ
nr:MAM and LDL-receptor class A domain-containing protein 1-like [Parasteatoda tepidariorum]